MSKHARQDRINWKKSVAIFSGLMLVAGGIVSAQASTTLDVNNGTLKFDTAIFEVESAVLSGNVITYTTKQPHRLITQTQIVASGFTPSAFNKAAQIASVPTETTFTISHTAADVTATGMGIITVSNKAYSISGVTGDGTNAVYTTSSNHGYSVGQLVGVQGVTVTGASGSDFNFTSAEITAVTNNTFTIARDSQGTYASGGLVRLGQTDVGVNMRVNDYVDYSAVFVSGGTTVNARVTMTEQTDLEGRSGTPGQVDELDETRTDDPAQNAFLNTGLDFETGLGDSYAQFTIQFYTGTPSSRTAITLENVSASVYDIDGLQYVELSNYTRYFRSTDTELDVSATARGTTRFAESDNQSFSGNDSFTKGRVTAEFDSVSLFTYRIGKTATVVDTGSAFYQLDFSPGWDVGGAWTSVQAAAVNAPVYSAPAPAPYTGPLPVSLSPTCVPAVGGVATLTGERLNTITSAEVDGKAVTISDVTATSVKLTIPALAAGTYSVVYNSSSGRLTHQDSLKVCATAGSTPPTVTPGAGTPFQVQKRFTGYRGDRGPVVARDLAAITRFIQDNPGLKTVTCQGSTSGVPALSTDPALARARAENACRIVSQLVPGITTRIAISTGKGTGQFFRAVTIFGRGERAN